MAPTKREARPCPKGQASLYSPQGPSEVLASAPPPPQSQLEDAALASGISWRDPFIRGWGGLGQQGCLWGPWRLTPYWSPVPASLRQIAILPVSLPTEKLSMRHMCPPSWEAGRLLGDCVMCLVWCLALAPGSTHHDSPCLIQPPQLPAQVFFNRMGTVPLHRCQPEEHRSWMTYIKCAVTSRSRTWRWSR